ncbi:hypothetical protein [Sporosarcina jiandibaonis]|uniref:hypothetical protein n=1 Tax=Sporosarcina jiandibaonis TaxID=2715535 RepID=UPI001551E0E1|nr:hypothetical protein [Sporosarcina jiandibaonis]
MTELELYKFTQDKEIDWRGDSLMLWIDPSDIQDFAELIGDGMFDDGGLKVTMVHGGTLCIDLDDVIMDDIELENILPKEEEPF